MSCRCKVIVLLTESTAFLTFSLHLKLPNRSVFLSDGVGGGGGVVLFNQFVRLPPPPPPPPCLGPVKLRFFSRFSSNVFSFLLSQICELDHCFLLVWDLTKCVTSYWHKLTVLCSCADQTFHFLCCLHHSHNGGFYRQKGL